MYDLDGVHAMHDVLVLPQTLQPGITRGAEDATPWHCTSWRDKEPYPDETVAPGRDRAFKPAGEEKGRAQDLFQEFGGTKDLLYALLPKHIGLRKLKESV